jgi:beta-lactamase regulating signal transducer with metallopeptidase domain
MGALFEIGLVNAGTALVLAVLVAGFTHVCRRPALVHCLWILVLLKLLTPPVVPVAVPWPRPPAVETAGPAAPTPADADAPGEVSTGWEEMTVDTFVVTDAERDEESSPSPTASSDPVDSPAAVSWTAWRPAAEWIWLVGSMGWLAWTACRLARSRRLLAYARPAPARLQERVNGLAWRLGLRRPPPVYLVPGAVSPMVWAPGTRPCLLFPRRLLDRLGPDQQAALLLHELAHVRRGDHWVRLFELAVTVLFWWHPVVWWAKREIHEAEEQCCDAWVVWAMAGAGRPYALALVQTVEFCSQARSPLPAAASGVGPVPHLRRRLTMIMQGSTPRSLSWAGAAAVLCWGLALPLVPVRAQEPADAGSEEAQAQDPRDQQIEALKKAIRILEEQRRGERPGEGAKPKADPAELDLARHDLERAKAHLDGKRREMEEAQARMREAAARLSRLEGRPAEEHMPRQIELRLDNVAKPGAAGGLRTIVVPADAKGVGKGRIAVEVQSKDGKVIEHRLLDAESKDGKSEGDGKRLIEIRTKDGKVERVLGADGKGEGAGVLRLTPSPATGRPADLEQRLDRLLKEVEDLRRELRRRPVAEPRGLAPATPAGVGAGVHRAEAASRYSVPVGAAPPPAVPAVPAATHAPPSLPASPAVASPALPASAVPALPATPAPPAPPGSPPADSDG